MQTDFGAYCSTAEAIVPIYDISSCEWCDRYHDSEYRWEFDSDANRPRWKEI